MRGKWLALAAALALLCTACGGRQAGDGTPEGQYSIYFPIDLSVAKGSSDGAVLDRELRTLPEGETVDGLMEVLLSGPESVGLTTPFPRGTAVRSWRVENAVAKVDLTEVYGGLSGVELSLADSCIVLTLCQLEEVESVYLTVEGRPRPFRDQVLAPADLLLDNGSGGPETVDVELWFLREEGLTREERTLRLDMGDQVEIAAVQALLAGPEGSGCQAVAPEGSELLSLRDQGSYYLVELDQTWLEGEEDERRLYAIVNTLSGLRPEAAVVFQVEGQRLERYGGVDLSQPLTADLSLEV